MYRCKQQQEREENGGFFSSALGNLSVLIILLVITSNSQGAFGVNQFKISGAGDRGILTGQNALNATLAAIGREIVQPHSISKSFTDSHGQYTKSLPAVPAAILLVLTGFCCVSAVRDRKVWLAALAGILWLSQGSLPNVIKTPSTRIRPNGHFIASSFLIQAEAKIDHLPVSMESSEYLGLLYHRPGVPENRGIIKILHGYRSRKTALATDSRQSTRQLAINFTSPYSDSAVKSESFAEKHIILLSALSPVILPRGPPIAN
jgi:hypothetical protein